MNHVAKAPVVPPPVQESAAEVRVVIIEDDPVYRSFVRQVLRKIEGVSLIGEALCGKDGIELCLEKKPQALLIDLLLPDMQGIEVVRVLRTSLPELVILMITAHPSNQLPRELLNLGVQGFADKTATAGDLAKTVRSVLSGGISYTSVAGLAPPPQDLSANLPGHTENIKPDILTPREREIARLVTAAMSSKEVAAKLNLSTRTVEKHRANIYAKLGVRDVVGLTRWCMFHGLLG